MREFDSFPEYDNVLAPKKDEEKEERKYKHRSEHHTPSHLAQQIGAIVISIGIVSVAAASVNGISEKEKELLTAPIITQSQGPTAAQLIQGASDHVWGDDAVYIEPTCTEAGYDTKACIICGLTQSEALDPLGHKEIVSGENIEPGCTEVGYAANIVCERCGLVLQTGEEIPALGHDYGEGVETTEAGCTTDGIRTFTCSRCGDSYTQSIPKLGHKDANNDYYCDACGTKTLTLSFVSATLHMSSPPEIAFTWKLSQPYDPSKITLRFYSTMVGWEVYYDTYSAGVTQVVCYLNNIDPTTVNSPLLAEIRPEITVSGGASYYTKNCEIYFASATDGARGSIQ